MKNLHSVKMFALLTVLAAGSVQGYSRNDCGSCEGPLEAGKWFVTPKIGVAPTIFAGRGHEQRISPLGGDAAAQRAVVCSSIDVIISAPVVLPANQNNVLQQDACRLPKFSQVFGIPLHIAVEVGRNTCDNEQWFLEFVYDRANGKDCFTSTTNNYAAQTGCSSDCSSDCSTTTSGTQLSSSTRTTQFNNYTDFGGFIGARHYCNRTFFCDRVSVWGGIKAGLLHRKAVGACITIPARTVPVPVGTQGANVDYTFAERDNISATVFCKSTSVAAGASFGLDYCFNDCLTLLFGFEVVASCALKSNDNVILPLAATPTHASGPFIPSGFFPQPTNIIIGNTGTLIQFPVWVGVRWEFDLCKSSCSPCA